MEVRGLQQFVLWWFGLGFMGAMCWTKLSADMGCQPRPGRRRGRVPVCLGASVVGPLGLLPFVVYLLSPIAFGMMVQKAAERPDDLSRLHKVVLLVLPEVVLALLFYVLILEPGMVGR